MNKALINFLCAFIPSKGRRHEFRQKYLSCNTDIMTTELEFKKILDGINLTEEKIELFIDKIYKIVDQKEFYVKLESNINNIRSTNEINSALLNIKDKIKGISNTKIENKNKFLLFKYTYKPHLSWSYTKGVNLGDYVQTVATKNALDTIFKNNQYEYFDRDNLTNYYGENIIAVIQGWFSHGYNFIPNDKILPVFVGTHFIDGIHKFLEQFLIYNGEYFKDKEIGCRDLHTLEFCKKNNIKAYFSRCLTLTLPKRKITEKQTKVFISNVPSGFLEYIPDEIKNGAEYINQRDVANEKDDFESNWVGYYSDTEKLLNRYRDEAKLVITTALHCAGPCLAMGIPVILLTNCEEQKTRFSALDGLIKINTIDDLKNNLVDYDNIEVPDIEELKKYILKNLELSIKKALHEEVDEIELQKIRDNIRNFRLIYESNVEKIKEIIQNNLTFLEQDALMDITDTVCNLEHNGADGEFIEAGVASGGSAIAIGLHKSLDRKLKLFDVYGIIPPPSENDEEDIHKRYDVIKSGKAEGLNGDIYYGYKENLLQQVKDSFTKFGLQPEKNNIQFIKGVYQDTMEDKINFPVAFAHIDCDWYDSVMVCLKNIAPHLTENGVLIIDDYYCWSGCKKAVDEYFADKKDSFIFTKKSRLHIVKKGSNVNTWKKEFKYTQSMENRIKQMLNLIDFNYNSVMDLGCGKQTLKKYIKDDTKYYPINQYNQVEGTIIKDFNKGEFLNQKVNICFASGILEYIYDIDQFIENISKNCDYFLGSYIFKEDMPERNPIWVNNFSKEELYKIIEKYGFELVKDCVCEDKHNSIYLFKKVK